MHSSLDIPPATLDRPPAPDLSVVIVTWNVRDDLLCCLRALLSHDVSADIRLEVIVVDNASTDGTLQAIADCHVTVIANSRNLGYGTANNIGLRAATGRYLLVLNPDTLPQPGSLANLVNFADTHLRAAIIAPRLLNADGSVQPSAFKFPTLAMSAVDLFPPPNFIPGRLRARLYLSSLNGRYSGEAARTAPFRIDHPLGACLLLRREAFEQCGGFDEHIFMYSEEVDLAIRYARAGWESWQVPASRVIHLGGQSTGQVPDRMFVELWRSRLRIYRKHYSRAAQVALRAMLRCAMLRDVAAGALHNGRRRDRMTAPRRVRRAKAVLRMMSRS